MGQNQKKKKTAEANAEHISGPHYVGRPSAAPHHIVAAASGGRHHVATHYAAR